MMRLQRRRLLLLLAIPILAFSAWRSIKLAVADHLYFSGEIEAMRRAIRIEPNCALYPAGLADQLANRGEDGRHLLRKAVGLHPHNAPYRIRLGLEEELAGRIPEAEEQLLKAGALSAKYAPRWALANFYFRQGEQDAFWTWARESAAIFRGDRGALFDLCWRTTPDAQVILERAIPPERPVRMDFAAYLVARSEWEAAEVLLRQLAEGSRESETGRFLAFIDQAIDGRRIALAMTLWNRLARSGALPYPELDPASGRVLTNGDFRRQPLWRAFDWRTTPIDGVFQVTSSDGAHHLSLSGDQPEDCDVLWQFLPILPARRYRLTTEYGSLAPPLGRRFDTTGLYWRLVALSPEPRLLVECEPLPADPDAPQNCEFSVPDGVRAGRLALRHRRASGETRMAGEVEFKRVGLELLGPLSSQ